MKGKDDTSEKLIPKINFNDVSFAWPNKKENLISNCSFSIDQSGLFMIVGKNGSGKSTFLKLISGILRPNYGTIDCLANIGLVFQNPDHQILMPNCKSELLISISKKISDKEIILSPSDFGFRNMLKKNKKTYFFDFEYAGLDDGVKLICDYFLQPDVRVPKKYLNLFIENLINERNKKVFTKRLKDVFLSHAIKWCCIILNVFFHGPEQ